jgi:hypothetical protein
MKVTSGKANPKIVTQLLKEKLSRLKQSDYWLNRNL